MREQFGGWHAGAQVIGIDEISIRKGHLSIVVRPVAAAESGLAHGSLGGESGVGSFNALGQKKCRGIYFGVMDMWKPFRNATLQQVPRPVSSSTSSMCSPSGRSLGQVRKSEYAVTGKHRSLSKARNTRCCPTTPISRWMVRRFLAKAPPGQPATEPAYVPQEAFGQLWDYQHEACARRFFGALETGAQVERLKPYEQFHG